MNTQQPGQYTMSMNAEANNKENSSEQLITNEPIENSPLRLVGQGNKWGISMGKYRVTPWYETREEAESAAQEKPWEMLMTVFGVMLIIHEEDKIRKQHETGTTTRPTANEEAANS